MTYRNDTIINFQLSAILIMLTIISVILTTGIVGISMILTRSDNHNRQPVPKQKEHDLRKGIPVFKEIASLYVIYGEDDPTCECPTPTRRPTKTKGPTDTPKPTRTKAPTSTPEPTKTDTPQPTKTLEPTRTNTPKPTRTDTPKPTLTDVPTSTPTATKPVIVILTETRVPSSTLVATRTPTLTYTPTSTAVIRKESKGKPTSTVALLPETGSDINLRLFTIFILGLFFIGVISTIRIYRYGRERKKKNV